MQKKVHVSVLGESYHLITDEPEATLARSAHILEQRLQLLAQRPGSIPAHRGAVVVGLQAMCEAEALVEQQRRTEQHITELCSLVDHACASLAL